MKKFGLPDKMRLKSRSEISRVFAKGKRHGNACLLAITLQNPTTPNYSRLCVAVSKKHGNAVKRNRLKRLVREAWRLNGEQLPAGYDVVLIPRAEKQMTLEELKNSICRLLRNVVKK